MLLSRRDARRVAVRAQLLGRERPATLRDLVRHVTLLQIDPTNAVAPTAHLVAWSRLGPGYDPKELDEAQRAGEIVEYRATLRPAEDMALYRAEMAVWPGTGRLRNWQEWQRDWVRANDACRVDILRRLTDEGPLATRELPDSCDVPWQSTGWNHDRSLAKLLDFMVCRGEVAVAGRRGNERLWDLAERVYPDVTPVPAADAEALRNARRLAALGIARPRGPECPVEPLDVGDAGVAASVEGSRGTWRVDPELLDLPFEGRTALLSPFDRVLHDRRRMADLFEFDYALEMYKPVARRRWGYFALPVLHGDRLVGKLDVAADRRAGVLRVNAMHWDVEVTAALRDGVDEEVGALAAWLGLEVEPAPRASR